MSQEPFDTMPQRTPDESPSGSSLRQDPTWLSESSLMPHQDRVAVPGRTSASPQPSVYPSFPNSFSTMQPPPHAPQAYQQYTHTGHYGGPAAFHPAHASEPYQYQRPPHRSKSQSSASSHDAGSYTNPGGAPYAPSYQPYPSYPTSSYYPPSGSPSHSYGQYVDPPPVPAGYANPMHVSRNYGTYGYTQHPGAYSQQSMMQARPNWAATPNAAQPLPNSFNVSSSGGPHRRQSNNSTRPGNGPRRAGTGASNSSSGLSSPRRGGTILPPKPGSTPQPQPKADLPEPSGGAADAGGVSQALDLAGGDDLASTASSTDVAADASVRIPGRGLRPHYHPQQGPRSDFVMWCGNVPQDATVEELWEVFSRIPPTRSSEDSHAASVEDDPAAQSEIDEGHGVLSIFIISRSNCAFVNYASPAHLEKAVKHFHGQQVRPQDPRCPKLVCRVRKKDDEAQAGVAGQRGRGIHVAWLKQQKEAEKTSRRDQLPSRPEPTPVPSGQLSPPEQTLGKDGNVSMASANSGGSYSSSGSTSYTSTNSSLFRHPAFRHRFFILKSLRRDDLDRSVETGYWATQPHNEAVLDQAYRNSESVYLIFGVNQTGQFYGYAKMAGPINTSTEAKTKEEGRRSSLSSVVSTTSGSVPPATILESADETDLNPGSVSGAKAHPTLEKADIDAARATFGAMSVGSGEAGDGALPMTSPLPISPQLEKAGLEGELISQQGEGTSTPRGFGSAAQSSTWPFTATKPAGAEASSSSNGEKVSSTSSEHPPSLSSRQVEPDEHGVRRIDMETESQGVVSLGDNPSLAPSDSVSWSSADPRTAEQIALRAVIHNLRLDEYEARRNAEKLESQLRSASNDTDATVTATGSAVGSDVGNAHNSERTPPRQSSSDSWGKPFRVDWIRTDPLPFHRVKRLRNPWRDNRQVKVSRDGTELEPGIGRQLLAEWMRNDDASVSKSPTKADALMGSEEEED